MNSKFVCGRLVITRDGSVKKLALADGGGTRDCTISHIDMGFEEIHDRLRQIFLLDRTNCNSKLYDFTKKELDKNRYTTFYDYIQRNGLKFRGTLLYLCTPADNGAFVHRPSSEKRRTIIDRNQGILRDQRVNNNKTIDRHSTSYSSRNLSIDPAPSSSRYHSERDSRKRTYASTRSPHRASSSYRKSTEDDNKEKHLLFKNLLNSFAHLLDVLHQRGFTSFYSLVQSLVDEIKSCRSTIKLFTYGSLYDAEQLIISITSRLRNRINDEYHRVSPHGISHQLENSCEKTLDSIQNLLTSLDHYKSQINKNKRSKPTYRSSPTEEKPIIHNSHQRKTRTDDGQSSEASHSSIGDEVLMEVARNGYEQTSNRYK